MSLFQKAEKLEDVKIRIQEILDHCLKVGSPLGYFAGLYVMVAEKIEESVVKGEFENTARLAQMDVNFVNYYIDAINCAFDDSEAPAHWQLAISAAKQDRYLVLQHLLVSMNAHINYDLANAVRDTVPANETIGFKNDFNKVNGILFSLLDKVQDNVASIFHPLKWYLKFGQQLDDKLISLTMGHMRNDAFSFTCTLALATDIERVVENKEQMDEVVDMSSKIIAHDKWYLNVILAIAKSIEIGTMQEKTAKLLK